MKIVLDTNILLRSIANQGLKLEWFKIFKKSVIVSEAKHSTLQSLKP